MTTSSLLSWLNILKVKLSSWSPQLKSLEKLYIPRLRIFAVTKGFLKPMIHLQLAIYLLPIRDSKNFRVMNRLGNALALQLFTQGLLTELVWEVLGVRTSAKKSVDYLTFYTKKMVFDNFDLFLSTSNGKDTMHKAVEIGIQTIPGSLKDQESVQPLFDDKFEEPITTAYKEKEREELWSKRWWASALSQESLVYVLLCWIWKMTEEKWIWLNHQP